ncbi:hypothetical protein BBO_08113 [Beauveria brongniartii RCEF 3172]|uniref:Uncharacterized protein n=1 Tax=Beauveria brongniartii RCEF 3172 TaxID=1081107 RepID=A0A166Y525_9HYPO|nr:hypothetical protein BBO_08113 [Beauveria brongniartii RCEF 3172]
MEVLISFSYLAGAVTAYDSLTSPYSSPTPFTTSMRARDPSPATFSSIDPSFAETSEHQSQDADQALTSSSPAHPSLPSEEPFATVTPNHDTDPAIKYGGPFLIPHHFSRTDTLRRRRRPPRSLSTPCLPSSPGS